MTIDAAAPSSRVQSVSPLRPIPESWVALSLMALGRRYDGERRLFSARGGPDSSRAVTRAPGPLLSTAVALLGLARLSHAEQQVVLGGTLANDLTDGLAQRTVATRDLDELAVISWIVAQSGGPAVAPVFGRLLSALRRADVLRTITAAWALSALTTVRDWHYSEPATWFLRDALVGAAAPHGLFPSVVRGAQRRSEKAVTADQCFAIRALAAHSGRTGDTRALEVAATCAAAVAASQSTSGGWQAQLRHGPERNSETASYHSVDHYALLPLAFTELARSGGPDHPGVIADSIGWVSDNTLIGRSLVDEGEGVIWRAIRLQRGAGGVHWGRRSGRPTERSSQVQVDRSCRPDELGWLLLTWQASAPSVIVL